MPKTYDVNLPDKTGSDNGNGNGSTKKRSYKDSIPDGFVRPSPFIREKYWAMAKQLASARGLKDYEGLDLMLSAYYEQNAEKLRQIEELMKQL